MGASYYTIVNRIAVEKRVRLRRLSPSQRILAWRIALSSNGRVSRADLFEALYYNDPDGGPFDTTVDVHLCHLRKVLRAEGLALRAHTQHWVEAVDKDALHDFLVEELRRELARKGERFPGDEAYRALVAKEHPTYVRHGNDSAASS